MLSKCQYRKTPPKCYLSCCPKKGAYFLDSYKVSYYCYCPFPLDNFLLLLLEKNALVQLQFLYL
jgi:hypothetical protein